MLHEGGCNSFKGELPKEPPYRGTCWRSRLGFEVGRPCQSQFTSKTLPQTKSPRWNNEMGAVIPELGDYIVSPFNAHMIALVSQVTGDGKRNPFSVLCEE